MAIKPAVNRRVSELKGFYEVLSNTSKESRELKENYEKEKSRVEEDYDLLGIVNPNKEELEGLESKYLLAEDKVKEVKANITKVMESIKKDSEKLLKNSKGLEEETTKLDEMKEKLQKDRENADKKIESKRRRLALLDGEEKNKLQEEIDSDISKNEETFKNTEEDISKQEKKVKNIADARESYEAYREEYNKYAVDKLPSLDGKNIKEDVEDIDDIEEVVTNDGENKDNSVENEEKEETIIDETSEKTGETEKDKVKEGVASGGAVAATKDDDDKKEKYEIKTKEDFDKAYKELKKGSLSREKRNVLYSVMEDPNKYEEFGITTGVIFNKAKYILKSQGMDMKADINQFITKSGAFSDEIKFEKNKDIRKGQKLSTQDLAKWSQIEKIGYDKSLNIEKYIDQVEQYKQDGKELTKEQEEMYNDAMFLKGKLEGYRKEIENYSSVKSERSIFYDSIDNTEKLPESKEAPKDIEEPSTADLTKELSSSVITEEELSKSVEKAIEDGKETNTTKDVDVPENSDDERQP